MLRAVLGGVALVLALACGASAITLADLAGTAQAFESSDGTLRFEAFDATPAGDANPDLSGYSVLPAEFGFTLDLADGDLSVGAGQFADLALSFRVVALNGLSIVGAELSFSGFAEGAGALANVAEDLRDTDAGEPFASLAVVVTGGGVSQTADAASFAGRATLMQAIKDIQAIGGPGNSAGVLSVTQRFRVVPEPASLALLASGLGLLAVRGRRDARRRSSR